MRPYGRQLHMLTYLVIANPICAARGVNIALGGKHAMKSQPCRKFSFLLSTICQPCTTKELLAAWLPPDACCTTFQSQLRKEQQMVKLYLKPPFLITWNCAAIPFNGNQVSPMKDSQSAIAHLDRCHTCALVTGPRCCRLNWMLAAFPLQTSPRS